MEKKKGQATSFIYGRRPVEELLKTNILPEQVQEIFLSRNLPSSLHKKISARFPKAPRHFLNRRELDRIFLDRNTQQSVHQESAHQTDSPTRHPVNHQGVIIKIRSFQAHSNDSFQAQAHEENRHSPSPLHWQEYVRHSGGLLVLLDSIQDPNNLGNIVRSAEALGAKALFITGKGASLGETVHRVSAGASLHLPVFSAANLHQLIHSLKKMGFWICSSADSVGSTEHIKKGNPPIEKRTEKIKKQSPLCLSHTQTKSLPPVEELALVIGHEGQGIRQLVFTESDFILSISLSGKTKSLNAGAAAGILMDRLIHQE